MGWRPGGGSNYRGWENLRSRLHFFFQAEDGIRDRDGLEFRRVLFRSSFKQEQQVSILTLDGRVIVPYSGYDKHVALIQQGATIGAAKLWYDKPRKQFYLLVSFEIEVDRKSVV